MSRTADLDNGGWGTGEEAQEDADRAARGATALRNAELEIEHLHRDNFRLWEGLDIAQRLLARLVRIETLAKSSDHRVTEEDRDTMWEDLLSFFRNRQWTDEELEGQAADDLGYVQVLGNGHVRAEEEDLRRRVHADFAARAAHAAGPASPSSAEMAEMTEEDRQQEAFRYIQRFPRPAMFTAGSSTDISAIGL